MEKREYDRAYHAKRSPESKARKVRLQRLRRQQNRSFIDDYKSKNPCECGEDHLACLEFHHKFKSKEINVSDAMSRGWGKERILMEIEKCVVLCANCHRKIHHKRKTVVQSISL